MEKEKKKRDFALKIKDIFVCFELVNAILAFGLSILGGSRTGVFLQNLPLHFAFW